MSADQLLGRLEADGIEHLWVVYHDYSGRSCAKTVPRERFEAVVERGVVFAHANLSMRMDDVQPADATFLADSGDFLAVPDPASYARVPHQPATARVHVFMRADDLSPWPGCPRTRLGRILDAYAEHGMSVRAGFEPEFFLFRRGGDGEYVPADRDGMYTVRGLDRHNALWRSVIDDMRAMDVTVEQLGKEYGPAQYEGTARYAEALRAVDNHLLFKDTLHARARESGLVASFMPKPFEHLPGCGLHVHLSLWNAAGERELSCGAGDEALSEVGRQMAAGLLAHAQGPERCGLADRQLVQAPAARLVGAGPRGLGGRQPRGAGARSRHGTARSPGVPIRRQRVEPLRLAHRAARGRARRDREGSRAAAADRLRHRPHE